MGRTSPDQGRLTPLGKRAMPSRPPFDKMGKCTATSCSATGEDVSKYALRTTSAPPRWKPAPLRRCNTVILHLTTMAWSARLIQR